MTANRHIILAGLSSLAIAVADPWPSFAVPNVILQASFDGINGAYPYGSALAPAGNGLFYGAVGSGGANGNGGVYLFDSNSGSAVLQNSFTRNGDLNNGSNPFSGLVSAGDGIYYGTTRDGGSNASGSIYAFDSSTSAITLKSTTIEFGGRSPWSALVAGGNGLYYGTTQAGGAKGLGTIYAFDSRTGIATLKASFDGFNGVGPVSALTASSGGIFYGTSQNGVYAFDSTTNSITNYANLAGRGPISALTSAGSGIYYGTGSNYPGVGAIYAFDSATGSTTLKASFDVSNGADPYPTAGLVAGGNGIYYGATTGGGANGKGAVYAFNAATNTISLQASFGGSIGSSSYSALVAGGNGLYYGTTLNDGVNGVGAIYAFDPDTIPDTPAPLPLMGAGAAWGWSRRLRRRIQQAKSVFTMKS